MMNSAFNDVGATTGDYYPEPLRPNIDRINSEIYDRVNNGVYRGWLRHDPGGLRGGG